MKNHLFRIRRRYMWGLAICGIFSVCLLAAASSYWFEITTISAVMLSAFAVVASVVAVGQLLYSKLTSDLWCVYRQLESVYGLYNTLEPEYLLPPTRGWAASPDYLRLIVNSVAESKPLVIVEAGCGVSTVVCALAAKKYCNARIISLEHELGYADECRRQIEKQGLSHMVEVVHAPLIEHSVNGAIQTWYDTDSLAGVEQIDLLIIDGPPPSVNLLPREPALSILREKLHDSSVVLLDDAARSAEMETVALWERQFVGVQHQFVRCEKGASILRFGRSGRREAA